MIVLRKKYFRHITAFDYVDTQAYLEAVEKILPQYQPLFEKYKGNLDWRLLAAVAYQESHWDPLCHLSNRCTRDDDAYQRYGCADEY